MEEDKMKNEIERERAEIEGKDKEVREVRGEQKERMA